MVTGTGEERPARGGDRSPEREMGGLYICP